jgi:hypothetical protein
MAQIEQILFLPPMAVARLGGSDSPLEAFTWAEDPSLHGAGLTVITPTMTLAVQSDGSVRPNLPDTITFRDGNLYRPAAPFLELWAIVQGSNTVQPLTLNLLAENGAGPQSLSFTVTAANRKAARRTADNDCAFQASVTVIGTDNGKHPLLASSNGVRPLVSQQRPIPLGTFQVIRPVPRSEMGIDLSIIRVRYTPAKGLVYGPPGANSAADPDNGRQHVMVLPENQILNSGTAWATYNADNAAFDNPQPWDTYDGSDDTRRNNLSFSIVDDTCDVVVDAAAVIGNRRLTAQARVFCGPPDFAPDRRPFISLADDLVDRDPPADAAPPEALQDALDRLGDLFQRAYETASMVNVDATRRTMMSGQPRSRFKPETTLPNAMTKADVPYFDKDQDLNAPPTTHERLPYASVAHDVHASMTDVEDLLMFLQTNPDLVRRLIRPPYGAFSELPANIAEGVAPNATHRDPRVDRDGLHDMRMPPFMRDSDASPLSLTRRQYQFLMDVLSRVLAPAAGEVSTVAKAVRKRGIAHAPRIRTRVTEHVAQVSSRRTAAPGQEAQRPAPKPQGPKP